jgi:hypothetical protein
VRGLVTLQGAIWLFVAVGIGLLGWSGMARMLAGHLTPAPDLPQLTGYWAAAMTCAGCGVTEVWLSSRLRRAARLSWTAALAAECLMAALGWFLLYPLIDFGFVAASGGLPADLFLLPVPIGGLLSLAAAGGLLLPRSRRYFAAAQ